MPDKKKARRIRAPLGVIERDFNDALDRLIEGRPRHSRLKRLAAEGRLTINPTTVAEEAGRSRTLIAMESCRLPAVRTRIITSARKDEVAAPRTASEVITRLRGQVVELKRQLAASLEAQAEHFLARENADREAEKWRAAHQRELQHQKEDAKVTSIRRMPKI